MKPGLVININNPEVSYIPLRLVEEGRKLDQVIEWQHYEDFSISFKTRQMLIKNGQKRLKFTDYKWVYFCASQSADGYLHTDLKTILVKRFVDEGVRVINGESYSSFMHFSKLIQHDLFQQNHITFLDTQYMANFVIDKLNLGYPMVVKKSLSAEGKDVHLIRNEQEMRSIINKYTASQILIERYIPITYDYRVFCVGGRALGVMKRMVTKGEFKTNIAQGGLGKKDKLTTGLKTLAEKVAKVCSLDICGVDILTCKNKYYVIEVNRHPNFEGFEKATGINVARKIVEFLTQGKITA